MPSWRSIAAVVVVALGIVTPGVAHAAPPSNDDIGAATPITTLPFTAQQSLAEATTASDDPGACDGYSPRGSVWFSHTATEDGFLRISTDGSSRQVLTTAFTGERGDLRYFPDNCTSTSSRPITFRAKAGTRYHFMVSDSSTPGAQVNLTVQRVAPLANDDFANAQAVPSLPFSTPGPDLALAGYETDEPVAQGCSGYEGSPSAWYSYTPATTQSVLARVQTNGSGPRLAIYDGPSLTELRQVGCTGASYYDGRAMRLNAGTTYYIQVSGPTYNSSPVTVRLDEAPALQTSLYTGSSGDRSVYETIGFTLDHSAQWGNAVTSVVDFGDGTTSAPTGEEQVGHRYSVDGVYTVTVSATSADGRTATDTTTVTVKTHDVAITRFTPPASARAGQQKQITVQVGNTRHLEKATVTLFRSDGDWWKEVGVLTLDVPAHPTRKVSFPFAYTFTPEDAAIGKVTFRAVLSLPYPVQDARPMDNEVIAIATTVRPAATTTALAN